VFRSFLAARGNTSPSAIGGDLQMNTSSSSLGSSSSIKTHATSPLARLARRVAAILAAVLTMVSAGSYLYHRRQLDAIAGGHLRLVVTGPSHLQVGAAANFNLITTDVTGSAVAAQVEFALYSADGKRLQDYHDKTDESGMLQMTVPGDMALPAAVQLRIAATRGQRREEIETTLPVEPTRYLAYVGLDRPWYRAGETIRYRAVRLSQFGSMPDGVKRRWFELRGPDGAATPYDRQEVDVQQGVASGTLAIPADAASGGYRLVIGRSGSTDLEQEWPLFVGRAAANDISLKFLRESYAPGDTVVAQYDASSPTAHRRTVQVLASIDGQTVLQNHIETDTEGRLRIEFKLPKSVCRGGRLEVACEDHGTPQRVGRAIPIATHRLDLHFYPEGGRLAAGLESRVYFTARTPLGQAAKIHAVLVDSSGGTLANVDTLRDGRGSFTFWPQEGEQYRLKILKPTQFADTVSLPPATAQQRVTLSTSETTCAAGAPLEIMVRAAKSGMPLVAAVWSGEVLVGQQALVSGSRGGNLLSVPLDDQVAGVLRVIVYDYSANPPTNVAERLVFRRPARRLNIVREKISKPGQSAEGSSLVLRVTDEQDKPTAAVMGASFAAGALREQSSPSLAAYFWLTSGLNYWDRLQSADDYLGDSKDAAVAMDLLLGTQDVHWQHGAAVGMTPPIMFDNLNDLRARYEDRLAAYRAQQTQPINALITLCFFGGLALLLSVVLLGLMKIVWGLQLLVPALAATACCAVVAVILLDPARLQSDDHTARAFTSFSAPATSGKPVRAINTPNAAAPSQDNDAPLPLRADDNAAAACWHPLIITDAEGRATIPLPPAVAGRGELLIDAVAAGRIGSTRAK
jgi:hypothetical protein